MSDTGLYTGIYQHIHHYADLVDQVLVCFKGGTVPEQAILEELARFLTNLAEEQYDDLSTRLTVLVFHYRGELTQDEMKALSQKLLAQPIESVTIEMLEKFARLLEQQQQRALSRIQRWAR